MSTLELYLITRLDEIKVLLLVVSILFLVASVVYFSAALEDGKDITKTTKKKIKKFFVAAIFFAVLNATLPTTEEMIVIRVVPGVLNNEQVKKLPENVLKYINSWLERNMSQDSTK